MRFSGNNHIQTKVMALLLMGLLGNRLTAGTEAHYAAVSSLPKPVSSSLSVPFEVGEKFTYSVSWKVFEAGIATMTLVEKTLFQNEETYKINATVHSTGIVSTLFKVVDVFESFFHSRELCSRQIVKNIQEGRRHRNTVVAFDPKTGQARMEDKDLNRPDLPSKKTSAPIPGCVQDVVSALYLIRTKNLRVGDLIHFPINDGGRTYDVAVEIQAQEEVRTPAGAFQTLRLEPKVFGGLFKNKGRMFVWLTNDQEKMPVQLKAKINIGTITAALTQIDRRPLLGFHEPAKAGNRP